MNKLSIPLLAVILVALALPVPALAQTPVECEFEYTVQAGDWLSKISEKYFGNLLAYDQIVVAANASGEDLYTNINDPNLIEPGWLLCIPSDGEASTGPQSAPPGLSPEELANATYQGIYEQPVTLTSGTYEGEPFVDGGASRPTVTLIPNLVAYGDLNGDGQADAVVLLAENSGGSGVFIYLAAMVSQDGQPVNVATTPLGDRVEVKALKIENNQIMVDMVQAGPDDPMCCPSQQVIKTFELQGDQLVETSSQVVEGDGGSLGLAGTSWQLASLNGNTVLPDVRVTANFADDGQVTGSGGCNNYFAPYEVEGNNLTVGPAGTTLMACPDPISQQESDYLGALTAAKTYQAQDNELILLDENGNVVATFMALKPVALEGSSWAVRAFNNGKEAVVSVIIGTELTATFGADGNLSGSGGCNNYNSTYQVEGETISIGPGATTLMICAEPEDIMDQEQQYLAALQMADTYRIDGERMEMRTAGGSKVADFVSAVTGQVTYLERIALPSDTVVKVQLQDVSLADAPATVIGEQFIPTNDRQVPFPFEVTYDPGVIKENHTYSLNVRIEDGTGKLLFINTQSYPVITNDNPIFGVEVVVDKV